MENRIKECQLDLDADRTGAPTMRANQLRLWLSSLAYVLMEAVRRLGLAGTAMADATAGTIRFKVLKIGAVVTLSVRRIKIAFASACQGNLHARACPAAPPPRTASRLRRLTAPAHPSVNHRETAPSLPIAAPPAAAALGCPARPIGPASPSQPSNLDW
jgi:hypothetical protein